MLVPFTCGFWCSDLLSAVTLVSGAWFYWPLDLWLLVLCMGVLLWFCVIVFAICGYFLCNCCLIGGLLFAWVVYSCFISLSGRVWLTAVALEFVV